MTFPEAIQFLYDLQLFGLKLGLENTRRLAKLAGDPQEDLRFIHVAGTNGKGSVCAMLESIYRTAGLRVGLFTSPHLVRFGERIQVNRQPIPDEKVVTRVLEMQRMLRDFPQDHAPTFFEVVTVLALRHFADERCDLVVWETGMGGRLDATNIVTPLVSLITNVFFDHEKWLGHTLAQIAAEKAGIIKPGVPALTTATEPEALEVIRRRARQAGAKLHEVAAEATLPHFGVKARFPLLGSHQRQNAALATATVRALAELLPAEEPHLREGLLSVDWPGRMQLVRTAAGQVNLLDGAHNPAGAACLREVLDQEFPDARPAMVIGLLRDKDWPGVCDRLFPRARAVYLVPVASARTASPEELRAICAARWPDVPVSVCHSVPEALRLTHQETFRVLTGSLYLVGEALELLGALSDRDAGQRRLNDWQ